MAKKEKVTDEELKKWTHIIGVEWMIGLYIHDKISLTSKQVDSLIKDKDGPEKVRIGRSTYAKIGVEEGAMD